MRLLLLLSLVSLPAAADTVAERQAARQAIVPSLVGGFDLAGVDPVAVTAAQPQLAFRCGDRSLNGGVAVEKVQCFAAAERELPAQVCRAAAVFNLLDLRAAQLERGDDASFVFGFNCGASLGYAGYLVQDSGKPGSADGSFMLVRATRTLRPDQDVGEAFVSSMPMGIHLPWRKVTTSTSTATATATPPWLQTTVATFEQLDADLQKVATALQAGRGEDEDLALLADCRAAKKTLTALSVPADAAPVQSAALALLSELTQQAFSTFPVLVDRQHAAAKTPPPAWPPLRVDNADLDVMKSSDQLFQDADRARRKRADAFRVAAEAWLAAHR